MQKSKYFNSFFGMEDIYSDSEVLFNRLYNKILPSIRLHLQKRSVTISQNIYTGFDTEYEKTGLNTNRLISAQISSCVGFFLKIPLNIPFKFSNLNITTNELYPLVASSLDLVYIEDLINDSIYYYRGIKYRTYDINLNKVIKNLIDLNYPSIQSSKESRIVFKFEKSVIRQSIIFQEILSLKDLVTISRSLVQEDLTIGTLKIEGVLKHIQHKIQNQNDKENYENTMFFTKLQMIEKSSSFFRYPEKSEIPKEYNYETGLEQGLQVKNTR